MFKIRKKIYPESGYEICEDNYRKHLEKKRQFIDDNLVMMFSADYFHDGNLLDFRYDYKNAFIEICLLSPNFVDESNHCINVTFFLRFHNIEHFLMKKTSDSQIEWGDAVFMHGELGSLACSDERISLIMQFITGALNSVFYVEIICGRIEITPREELFFQYLLNAKKIKLLTE